VAFGVIGLSLPVAKVTGKVARNVGACVHSQTWHYFLESS
jgi:hypothetical protein